MNIGKAVAICENINSEIYSLEDKVYAVQMVMNMPTHMGIKKYTMIEMIKWLWNFNLEVRESHNGKRIVELQTPHGDLIDRDRALYELCESNMPKIYRDFCRRVLSDKELTPTVIEAEE